MDVSNPTPDDDDDDATSNDDVDSQVLQHGDDEDDDGDDDAMDDLEPWVDWIKRCTHDVEARLKKLKLDDWTTMQKRRKWRWAGKLARCDDDDWMLMAIPGRDLKSTIHRR